MTTEERFWKKVSKTAECWVWLAAKTPAGYGRFRFNGKAGYAHRYSLSLIEELNPELEVDHSCRNRSCVNPTHLNQVTHSQNISTRLRPKKKSLKLPAVCKRGHVKSIDSKGRLYCKPCANERVKRYYKTTGKEKHRIYTRDYYRRRYATSVK